MFVRAMVCVSVGAAHTKAGNVVHFPLGAMLAPELSRKRLALRDHQTKAFLALPYTS